ncbi:hypothetical protein M422DRAFT_197835 [Sphaerobolus stellatus SS14]|nr:hypothetical protein M422DRAFT_197835 [Sphaerobolus stellatus SS14]
MDKFVTITKPSVLADKQVKGKAGGSGKSFKYNPYPIPKSKERQVEAWRDQRRTEKILKPLQENKKQQSPAGSSKDIKKHLLNTLKDASNPITHSSAYSRAGHVDSCVTGHQRSDGGRPPAPVMKSRVKKLEEQRKEKGCDPNGVLAGVKIYVGGYLAGTTDIEIKRIVTLAGGKIMHTAGGATHILTSRGLSAGKTHKFLHNSNRNKVHVVNPAWVTDSIEIGKRKNERDYSVIANYTQRTLEDMGMPPASSSNTSSV